MKKFFFIIIGLFLISQMAFANAEIMNEAIFPLSVIGFSVWLIAGFFLRRRFPDLVLINRETLILVAIGILIFHFMLMVWMIYLAIVFIYFLFPKKHINSKARRLNLIYHGIFLGIIVAGGIISKIVFWKNLGGFSRYAFWMRENYPVYLTMFLSICAIEIGIIWIRKRAKKAEKTHLFQ